MFRKSSDLIKDCFTTLWAVKQCQIHHKRRIGHATIRLFLDYDIVTMSDYIDLELSSPWLNAAGALGFAPGADGWSWPEMQGGFVTNPVSANPRTPAETRAALSYPGGSLLHSGLPNPGLKGVLRKYAERWARSSLPVWVHLLGDGPEEIHRMALVIGRGRRGRGRRSQLSAGGRSRAGSGDV